MVGKLISTLALLPEKRNRPILQIAASSCAGEAGGSNASISLPDGATGSVASAPCHRHSSFRRRERWERMEMEER